MIRKHLCDYSEAYMHVKGTITVQQMARVGATVTNTDIKVIFKNCASLIDCITEINNTQVDDAQKTDIVMPMNNLMEYSGAYSNTLGSL